MDTINTISISNFKLKDKIQHKLWRILTPFSMEFWLVLFLLYCMYLLNRYVVANFWVNLLYIAMCVVIMLF